MNLGRRRRKGVYLLAGFLFSFRVLGLSVKLGKQGVMVAAE